MLEDLRGEMEIVNSKSEEEDDENECDGDEGSVYDFVSFALFLVLFFPISALFFSTTSYMVASHNIVLYSHGFRTKIGETTQLYNL